MSIFLNVTLLDESTQAKNERNWRWSWCATGHLCISQPFVRMHIIKSLFFILTQRKKHRKIALY